MGFLFDKDTHRSTLPVRTISCPRRRNMLCMRVVSGKFSCTAGCAACRPADAPPRCLPGHCLPVLRPGRSTARRSAVCLSCGPAGAQLATPPTLRPAACRGTARRSCDPAEAQLAEALPAGLAALPEHSLPKRRLPVLRPCRSAARRPRYAKKRSSSSRAAMSDSAMRRLSFDLSV